jgi:uncharacterized protein YgiM (DUF1202 family)
MNVSRVKTVLALALALSLCVSSLLAIPAVASAGSSMTPNVSSKTAVPDSTCSWVTTGNPLYVRSGPGTNYPVTGASISYGTLVHGNCSPTNNFYFILDPFDRTYHWANGNYLNPQ